MSSSAVLSQSGFKNGTCKSASQETRSWRALDATLVRRTGLIKEETSFTSPRHLVLLNLQGDSERGEYFVDSRKKPFVPRKPGDLLFLPAESDWRGWEEGASKAAYLALSIDPAYLAVLFERSFSSSTPALSPDLGFKDAVIMNAARGIGAEIRDHAPMSSMLVESYVATIFAQLLRKQNNAPTYSKGGLSGANMSRIVQKIEEDLTSDLSLSQLAEIVGLSVPHFCRAFRQSAGCPPYVFIIRRRVERAKDLLLHSSTSITEIALTCGFSSSSHFSNTFRREVGTTPLDYRRAWPGN